MRQQLCTNSTDISDAYKLRQVFHAVISGTLDELKAVLGMSNPSAGNYLMHTLLVCAALQLDLKTLRLEAL